MCDQELVKFKSHAVGCRGHDAKVFSLTGTMLCLCCRLWYDGFEIWTGTMPAAVALPAAVVCAIQKNNDIPVTPYQICCLVYF